MHKQCAKGFIGFRAVFLHPHWAMLVLIFLVMPYPPSTASQAVLQGIMRSCLVIERVTSSLISLLPQCQGRPGLLCLLLCLLPWEGRSVTQHRRDACPHASNQKLSKQGKILNLLLSPCALAIVLYVSCWWRQTLGTIACQASRNATCGTTRVGASCG